MGTLREREVPHGIPHLRMANQGDRATTIRSKYPVFHRRIDKLTIRKFPSEKSQGHHRTQRRGNLQVRMFFSSGAAQTNGGGSRCITMYSFES